MGRMNGCWNMHTANPKFTYVVCGRAVYRTVWLAVFNRSIPGQVLLDESFVGKVSFYQKDEPLIQ